MLGLKRNTCLPHSRNHDTRFAKLVSAACRHGIRPNHVQSMGFSMHLWHLQKVHHLRKFRIGSRDIHTSPPTAPRPQKKKRHVCTVFYFSGLMACGNHAHVLRTVGFRVKMHAAVAAIDMYRASRHARGFRHLWHPGRLVRARR
jgi:hypothetical protein